MLTVELSVNVYYFNLLTVLKWILFRLIKHIGIGCVHGIAAI